MNFNVKLTNTAQKELRRLPTKVKRQVANALDALAPSMAFDVERG